MDRWHRRVSYVGLVVGSVGLLIGLAASLTAFAMRWMEIGIGRWWLDHVLANPSLWRLSAFLTGRAPYVTAACAVCAIAAAMVVMLTGGQRLRRVAVAATVVGVAAGLSALAPSTMSRVFVRQQVVRAERQALATPNDPRAWLEYAKWLDGVGRASDGLTAAKKARALVTPPAPEYELLVGQLAFEVDGPEQALGHLQEAYQTREQFQREVEKMVSELERRMPEPLVRPQAQSLRWAAELEVTAAVHSYAACLMLLGRWAETRQVIQARVKEQPNSGNDRILLALLIAVNGQGSAPADPLDQQPRLTAEERQWLSKYLAQFAGRAQIEDALQKWSRERLAPYGRGR